MTSEMSEGEALVFAYELDRSVRDKRWARQSKRQLRRQLRWQTRVRLGVGDVSNHVGIWLCDHGRYRLAELLWGIRR